MTSSGLTGIANAANGIESNPTNSLHKDSTQLISTTSPAIYLSNDQIQIGDDQEAQDNASNEIYQDNDRADLQEAAMHNLTATNRDEEFFITGVQTPETQ